MKFILLCAAIGNLLRGNEPSSDWKGRITLVGAKESGTNYLHTWVAEHPAFSHWFVSIADLHSDVADLDDNKKDDKVVIVLRDPVERAKAAFQACKDAGDCSGSFVDAVDAGVMGDGPAWLEDGRVTHKVKEWTDARNAIVLFADELTHRPFDALKKVEHHCGVRHHEFRFSKVTSSGLWMPQNSKLQEPETPPIPSATFVKLAKHFESDSDKLQKELEHEHVPWAKRSGAGQSQVIVIGAHHSGTSTVTHMLAMLGLFPGETGDILFHRGSGGTKYWEQRAAVRVNEARLSALSPKMEGVPSFLGLGYNTTSHSAVREIAQDDRAKDLVEKLGARRPSVMKDPRFTLTLSEWGPLLDRPVCVLVTRSPAVWAASMSRYASLSEQSWLGLWAQYEARSVKACHDLGAPIVSITNGQMANPVHAVRELHSQLTLIGIPLTSLPSDDQVHRTFGAGAPSADLERGLAPGLANEDVDLPGQLYKLVTEGASFDDMESTVKQVLATDWPTAGGPPPMPTREDQAYAMVLTGGDVGYLAGALVLTSSIRRFDTSRPIVALLSPDCDDEWGKELQKLDVHVKRVEKVPEFWWGSHEGCASDRLDENVRWGREATKLRLWELTEYEQVLYLDADVMVVSDPSVYFEKLGHGSFAAEAPTHAFRKGKGKKKHMFLRGDGNQGKNSAQLRPDGDGEKGKSSAKKSEGDKTNDRDTAIKPPPEEREAHEGRDGDGDRGDRDKSDRRNHDGESKKGKRDKEDHKEDDTEDEEEDAGTEFETYYASEQEKPEMYFDDEYFDVPMPQLGPDEYSEYGEYAVAMGNEYADEYKGEYTGTDDVAGDIEDTAEEVEDMAEDAEDLVDMFNLHHVRREGTNQTKASTTKTSTTKTSTAKASKGKRIRGKKNLAAHHFNAGVMALKPSKVTFDALLRRGKGSPPRIFGNAVDCTEQALLNVFFGQGTTLDVGRSDERSHGQAAVHFIMSEPCPKPWKYKPHHLPAKCDRGAYAEWNEVQEHVMFSLTNKNDDHE